MDKLRRKVEELIYWHTRLVMISGGHAFDGLTDEERLGAIRESDEKVIRDFLTLFTQQQERVIEELEKYRQSLSIKNEAERRQRIAIDKAISIIREEVK